MRIAVLSGKGGAGKTMAAVNLAATAGRGSYVDCDVEEPNGRLFLKPEHLQQKEAVSLLPVFDGEKCTGCRRCVQFCRFNALIYIKEKPKVFTEVCHSCGGCRLVCPEDAIREEARPLGRIEWGYHGNLKVITGILHPGEASGVPVIHEALSMADEGPVVIDCPPGSACSVMESVQGADQCILVAEPTAFGFHNFRMVYELATLMKKPCSVLINKMEAPYEPLETFCKEHSLPVLARIPFDPKTAELAAKGELLCESVPEMKALFEAIWKKLGGDAA